MIKESYYYYSVYSHIHWSHCGQLSGRLICHSKKNICYHFINIVTYYCYTIAAC